MRGCDIFKIVFPPRLGKWACIRRLPLYSEEKSEMEGKPKTYSGVLGQPSRWTDSEKNLWIFVLFIGCLLVCAARGALPVTVVEMSREFQWDKRMSGIILSSFYWGYTMTQVIGGQLSDRHGGEVVQWVFGLGWSSAILSVTVLASLSDLLVIFANFINGVCQGVFFPAIINIMSSRVHDDKRSFVYSIISSGCQVGFILSGILGSIFLFKSGWEYVFLLVGLSGVSWALSVRWLVKKSQHRVHFKLLDENGDIRDHRSISVHVKKGDPGCVDVPWKLLLKQSPIIAMFISHFAQGFFHHNLTAWTPTYFHETFPNHQDKAWLYNISPWLLQGFSTMVCGWVSNKIITIGVSITAARKMMEFVSLFGAGISVLFLSIIYTRGNSFFLSLVLVNFAFFCRGFEVSGSTLNPTDLAPSFCGVLYGMMNTLASLAGIVGVSFTGHILHTTDNWAVVFMLISVVCFGGLTVYLCFGSGKRLTHIDS